MFVSGPGLAWLNGRVTSVTSVEAPHASGFPYLIVILGGIAIVDLAALIFLWVRRGGRKRMMITGGCVVTVVVLLGSLIAWHAADQRRKASNWKAGLTRLGFPLELPSVPGYHVMGAFTGMDGALAIDMGRDGPATPGTSSVLSVSFYKSLNSEGADLLGMCEGLPDPNSQSHLSCQVKGPDIWMAVAHGMPYGEILARKQNMIVVVQKTDPQVPDSVLLRVVSSLRPATADEIAALPATNAG